MRRTSWTLCTAASATLVASVAICLTACSNPAPDEHEGPHSNVESDCAKVTTLGKGLGAVYSIVFDGTDLYVSTFDGDGHSAGFGNISRVYLDGRSPTLLATGFDPFRIAVDDQNVYFANSNESAVRSIPKAGGAPVVITSDIDGVVAIAVDSTHVYFSGTSKISRVPLSGGPNEEIFRAKESNVGIVTMKLDPSGLYFYASSGGDGGAITKLPLEGSPPIIVTDGLQAGDALTVADGFLYFVENGNSWTTTDVTDPESGETSEVALEGSGTLKKWRIDGSEPPVTLTDGQALTSSVAVSEGYVYWAGGDAGTARTPLRRMPIEGGAVEDLGDPTIVGQLTPCPGGVCWTDDHDGTVKRYEACAAP